MSVEQQDEKGRRKKEESIFEFASMVKELDSQIKELTEKKKVLKEEIRGLLKELEVRHLKNDYMEIKINTPKSFDAKLFPRGI